MLKFLFIVDELMYYLLALYLVFCFIITQQLTVMVAGMHLNSVILFFFALFSARAMPKLYEDVQKRRT